MTSTLPKYCENCEKSGRGLLTGALHCYRGAVPQLALLARDDLGACGPEGRYHSDKWAAQAQLLRGPSV